MLKRSALLLVSTMTFGVLTSLGLQSTSTGCSKDLELAGLCALSGGSSLTVSGTQLQPEQHRQQRSGSSPDSSSGPGSPDTRVPSVWTTVVRCAADVALFGICVPVQSPSSPDSPTLPTVGTAPAVTITDLAEFTPGPTIAAAEPENVGIAGMPTNFIAAASAQTQNGELFGIPLLVRFTPVGYDYDYGDGTVATISTAGRSWAALDQAQFTPTPTTHIYEQRGIYVAQVDVRYTAEVDFGTGWRAVPGEIRSEGTPQEIRIFEARTALVAHTCVENPGAPGC